MIITRDHDKHTKACVRFGEDLPNSKIEFRIWCELSYESEEKLFEFTREQLRRKTLIER